MYEDERNALVDALVREGLLKSGRLIAAMKAVERHRFVPDEVLGRSYRDMPQPIGFSQTISAPHMVAIMSELLGVREDSNVLEIGTGSGYQAAVLSLLAPRGRVVTVERVPELVERAKGVFESLEMRNIVSVEGDGTLGLAAYAPYDRIVVTAAAPKVPDALLEQLGGGGRLVIPVGDRWHQTLMLALKDKKGALRFESHGGVVFVPLVGKDGW